MNGPSPRPFALFYHAINTYNVLMQILGLQVQKILMNLKNKVKLLSRNLPLSGLNAF